MVILEYTEKEDRKYRFFLFYICWILLFYVFISQMVGNFAPSQVGKGAGPGDTSIILPDQMYKLEDLCLRGINTLTKAEQKVLSGFGAAASIMISLYALIYLLWLIIHRQSLR